jgi:xanthine dehydrogenase iron-sulfur cluster and FAD-binding subunit A
LNTFKYVVNGSITISDSKTLSKKTVALQDNEITIAKFTLKPSKSDSVKLDNMIFDFSGLDFADLDAIDNNVTVTVDGTDIEIDTTKSKADMSEVYYDGTDVDDITEEVDVEIKVVGLEPDKTIDGKAGTDTFLS